MAGSIPANGLLYVPPHACGCYIAAKLIGFNVLAPRVNNGQPVNVAPAEPVRKAGVIDPQKPQHGGVEVMHGDHGRQWYCDQEPEPG